MTRHRVSTIIALAATTAVVAGSAASASTSQVIVRDGVRVTVPAGWHSVRPAATGPISDPRTLLVAGTVGVHARSSRCQVAAYAIPAGGNAVVVLGWRSLAAAGGTHPAAGRKPLMRLTKVRPGQTECFTGSSATAQLWLAHRAYQVNVLVANGATRTRVEQALAVGRSFNRAR